MLKLKNEIIAERLCRLVWEAGSLYLYMMSTYTSVNGETNNYALQLTESSF